MPQLRAVSYHRNGFFCVLTPRCRESGRTAHTDWSAQLCSVARGRSVHHQCGQEANQKLQGQALSEASWGFSWPMALCHQHSRRLCTLTPASVSSGSPHPRGSCTVKGSYRSPDLAIRPFCLFPHRSSCWAARRNQGIWLSQLT